MARIGRTIKLAFASTLVLMLLALGALAGVSTINSGGINALLTGAYTTTTTTATLATSTQQLATSDSTESTQVTAAVTTDTRAATQQIGIVDARYAVQQAGPPDGARHPSAEFLIDLTGM